MRVVYSYGFWQLGLGDDLQTQPAQIDGHQATIMTASRDLIGGNEYRYVRAVEFELPSTEQAPRNLYLTVVVTFNSTCDDAVSRRIIESINFDRVPSA
jgi:hypothetical protein